LQAEANPRQNPPSNGRPGLVLLLLSSVWLLPLLLLGPWIYSINFKLAVALSIVAYLVAPVPAIFLLRRYARRLEEKAAEAEDLAEQIRLQLDTVRFRTARLREELQAADRQARLTHQLSLLGQFTAGFMHEFNNPLAIVAGRLEVLLDERKEDAKLCDDLEQMLKETRYMGNIARTLLQALRRERSSEVFEPCDLGNPIEESVVAFRAHAKKQGIEILFQPSDIPHVDVPEHVISEVVRGLLNNALAALKDEKSGKILIRVDDYQTAGARVIVRIEDNGPGVPEAISKHLFEPFVTQSTGRERLGLGLFLAASLLDMYDARIRYEKSAWGGAAFVLELPPTRFTSGQHYHWVAGGKAE
jgi:signal transduction histidine kinase